MPDLALKVINGPDKPALQWALTYPDRERVHFQLENEGIDAEIIRIDELSDGFSFAVEGIVRSGDLSGRLFHGTYSVETRAGSLTVPDGSPLGVRSA